MKNRNLIIGIAIILLMTFSACSGKAEGGANYGKGSFYVRANGSDNNKGTSENAPFKTLRKALHEASSSDKTWKITVIGILDADSEGYIPTATFEIMNSGNQEILITGKKNAAPREKAVLSGIKWRENTLRIAGTSNVRFENIDISGSKKNGIKAEDNAIITIGTGAVIKENQSRGIEAGNKVKIVVDGGEISNNQYTGIDGDCTVTINNGTFSDNGLNGVVGNTIVIHNGIFTNHREAGVVGRNVTINGGEFSNNSHGVHLYGNGGGVSTMSNGVISNNINGIIVGNSSTEAIEFTLTGGSITNNTRAGVFVSEINIGVAKNKTNIFNMSGGSVTGNGTGGDKRTSWDIYLAGGVILQTGVAYYCKIGEFVKTGGDLSGNQPQDMQKGSSQISTKYTESW